ncbi:MAG: MFS transporter [Ruminococcaceae bacterium]|nr:MFS transporter [Oscillospiraceae bacterium]
MFAFLLTIIYICFISLGLPDSLLGSAWPVLHNDIGVPVSFAGIISMTIMVNTIISSFFSDRLTKRFGAGKLTAVSIALTAAALFGFSVSSKFWMLIIWAIPYGLGAGAVDAVLNNYVALHFKAQHMSWLHCCWGIGASVSPYIMSFALVHLNNWNKGYLIVSLIQIVLSVLVFLSIPLWKKATDDEDGEESGAPLKLKEILAAKGTVSCLFTFFGYCALELSTSLWASSYLVQNRGISIETASAFASLFYIGITFGRGINGFLAMRFSDRTLIRVGCIIILSGILLFLLPVPSVFVLAGFIIIGLGCAPIYPCIIHMTPEVFGKERSQAMIGIEMAFAYIGFCIMPPLSGFLAETFSIALFPYYILALLVLMSLMHEVMVKRSSRR